MFLKGARARGLREMLMSKNCLFGYRPSCFQLSRTGPGVSHQTLLVSLLSSTKLHFCCSCIALCPRLLAELLGGQTWLRILSVDSWPPILGLLSIFASPSLSWTSWTTLCLTPFHLTKTQVLVCPFSWPAWDLTSHLALRESRGPMTLLFTL